MFTPTRLTDNAGKSPSKDLLYSAAIVALGASKKILQDFEIEEKIKSAREELRVQGHMNSEVLERIGLEVLLKWGIYDTPEGLIQRMSNLENLGVDLAVFGPPISHSKSSIKLLLDSWSMYRD